MGKGSDNAQIGLTAETLRQLELMSLKARRAFLGTRSGGHRSLRRGHGIEFSDYRAYELGDNPRHIDWGVFGRTDKVVVKRFQEEQNLAVLIILDGSRSMFLPEEDRKFQRGAEIALALTYVALQQHDSVSLLVPGAYRSPRLTTGSSFHHVTEALNQLTPAPVMPFVKQAAAASEVAKHPGLCVVISDFLFEADDVRAGFFALSSRGLDCHAVRVVGESDLNPFAAGGQGFIARDSESEQRVSVSADGAGAYQVAFDSHARDLTKALSQTRTSLGVSRANAPLSEALFKILPTLGVFE
jgi:uncharacterized protein (DUF58 family)